MSMSMCEEKSPFHVENGFIPYTLESKIGLGKSGECYIGIPPHENDNIVPIERFAVKVFNKTKENGILFQNEVKFLMVLKNTSGIIKYRQWYEDKSNYYIVSELGSMDLFNYTKLYEITEHNVKYMITKLLTTLKYLHSLNISHRDLKLENVILTSTKTEIYNLEPKIIDFGNAVIFVDDNATFTDLVGTIPYLSPERLKKVYSGWECKASDMWAIGVICYELLTKKRCFYGKNNRDIVKKILKGEWRPLPNDSVSSQAQNFVENLLNVDPYNRMNVEEALNHPWLNDINSNHDVKDLASLSPSPSPSVTD